MSRFDRFDVGMLLKVNETLRQIKLTIELLINIPVCICTQTNR